MKGHTKNDCDRNFNILKIKWHPSNVYTFKQALAVLSEAENVHPIDASNIHIDYTSLFERWYKQPTSGTIQKNHIFTFQKDTIKDCIMTTKRSYNAAVTSTQSIKSSDKKYERMNSSSWLRKLDILYARKVFLPKPGLKPIKQVHLYTKWRTVVPHPYKDKICPLLSNEVIRMVIKTKRPRKKKATTNVVNNSNVTNDNNNTGATTNDTTTTSRTTNKRRPKLKEHESRTVTKNGIRQHADPDEVGSDDDDSEYLDEHFDPLEILANSIERRQTRPRGKTFLPPKPEAPTTKKEKVERDKDVSETKEKVKNEKRKTVQRRITTRQQKKLEREKKQPPAKRLRSRTNYYNKLNTTTLI